MFTTEDCECPEAAEAGFGSAYFFTVSFSSHAVSVTPIAVSAYTTAPVFAAGSLKDFTHIGTSGILRYDGTAVAGCHIVGSVSVDYSAASGSVGLSLLVNGSAVSGLLSAANTPAVGEGVSISLNVTIALSQNDTIELALTNASGTMRLFGAQLSVAALGTP